MLGLILQNIKHELQMPNKLLFFYYTYNKLYYTYIIWFVVRPGDIIDDVGLQEKITPWKQILSDQILIGPHGNTITHA